MLVLDFDPGRHIGYACLDLAAGVVHANGVVYELKAVGTMIVAWASTNSLREVRVGVEDFLGAGPLNADRAFTIKVQGLIEGLCDMYNLECTVRQPSQRLPYVEQAEALCETTGPYRRDAVSALAHAIGHARNIAGKDIQWRN